MKSFGIRGKMFLMGSWHFVYVDKKLSQQIRDTVRGKKGSAFVRVRATLGKTSWTTTLFPTKDGPYLLAIKADVRKKEFVTNGDVVKIACMLL
jgi:hypothetical protein